jgi:hypothetical protein
LFDHARDAGRHPVDIAERLIVRDAQHLDSVRSQKRVAPPVVFVTLCADMRLAVDFDRQSKRCSKEVHDVGTDRMLATKLHAA